MLCERCKKNQATFHKSLNINGKVYETHLCHACANEVDFEMHNCVFSFDDFDRQFERLENSMIEDFFNLDNFFTPTRLLEKNNKKCDNCGSTFSDFLRRGKLGCANCYDTFEEEIRDMLENMDNPTDFNLDIGSEIKPQKPSEIEQLEQEFNKAIQEERYEDAGEIKKKINKMKEEN